MTSEILKRDGNFVTVLGAITDNAAQEVRMLKVDPDTGRVLVSATGGGAGTVTSVSVVTANGVSGSVANATTTPAITFTLGAITPTSVNGIIFSGTGGTTMTFPSTSGTVATLAATQTLTNKRTTPRVGTTTSSATPTINTDNVDQYSLTAQAADITSFTSNLSGTPTSGQKLIIQITGTASRAITWGAGFESSTVTLPTTTSSTAMLTVGFIYNSATMKWTCVAVA